MKPTEAETVQTEVSSACEMMDGNESFPLEPARPRTTSDASSQTPFSTLDCLAKVSGQESHMFVAQHGHMHANYM